MAPTSVQAAAFTAAAAAAAAARHPGGCNALAWTTVPGRMTSTERRQHLRQQSQPEFQGQVLPPSLPAAMDATRGDGTSSGSAVSFCGGVGLGLLAAAASRRQRAGSSGGVGRMAKAGGGKEKKKQAASVYQDSVLIGKTDFPQRMNATVREPEIQEFWRSERVYEQLVDRPASKGTFTLHDGPPYANGSLHMGHALNKILKDAINKSKAAQGYKVKYIPGWDCHGLPIELKVLQSKQMKKLRRGGMTPLILREKAAEFAQEAVAEQRQSFERYGVFGDFDSPYLTLLPKYEAAQLGIFEEMLRGGHIYRGRKPVYWSPSTRTALAESELEYPEGHVSQSIYVAFRVAGDLPEALKEKVDGEGLQVAIWTTTPWTIPANRAVSVNPALEYAVIKATTAETGQTRRLLVAKGLIEKFAAVIKAEVEIEAVFEGGMLEGLKYEHPITSIATPVVMGGDYITTESGTGLVHTAPGHGADDYNTGLKYGLEVAAPVDAKGDYTEEVGLESLVGANVLKDANSKVIEVLQEKNLLLSEEAYQHKYPYDWRSKKPVIWRATPQWFASIDGLRDGCLQAMSEVNFIPAKQANMMRPMIEGRSDWCISRQRSWGVPIPAFYHKETDEALLTPEIVKHVKDIFAEKGSNAWFELSVSELLPEKYRADADLYEKGTDTMDVWFDSGSSWAAMQDVLGSPVDLYLEGSDQHRGWFQSSLITSVAVQGRAPYKSVVTHGFCVDGQGKKMSKSIGNVIDPRDIIEGGSDRKKMPAYGADTLRLWALSVDFTFDVSISPEIMAQVGSDVATIRNRSRFMLANIFDFDHKVDAVSWDNLPLMDRHIICEAEGLFSMMTEAYDEFSFNRATKALKDWMSTISGFYLDVAKDRLYISAANSPRRRSCQTVLRWLLENLAKLIAPVLSHTAEDIWKALPGDKSERASSVFLAGWWTPFPGREGAIGTVDEAVEAYRLLLGLRAPTNIAMEQARKAQQIGGALEAGAYFSFGDGSSEASARLRKAIDLVSASPHHEDVDSLRWLLGVSQAVVGPAAGEVLATQEDEALGATVSIARAAGTKCERCWMFCESVGSAEAHKTLCARCVDVMDTMDVGMLQAA